MTAFYDIGGKLVGTTKQANLGPIYPAKVQEEMKTTYKDYKAGPVIYFDDNEPNETDMVMYGIQFDDTDTYLVELIKGTKKIVVQVDKQGMIIFKAALVFF